jgi:ParB family transcriptional regulator, chromosome partitioning protein
MELDLHQLDLRYEGLRKRRPRQERQLAASILESGQQMPIVVVVTDGRFVVIDGYKRVRALRRLSRDRVRVTVWEVGEAEALLMERLMRAAGEDALGLGWMLAELHERFALSCAELAKRCDKSKSWVSRLLSLVQDLPEPIQAQVRAGELAAYAAMKYLVPLARANAAAATRLCIAMTPLKPTTRQVGLLYQGFLSGSEKTRELILTTPQVYLRAQEVQREPKAAKSDCQQLLDDLGALSGIARRARRRLEQGLMQRLLPGEPDEVAHQLSEAKASTQLLFNRFAQEVGHAG